ncbi:LOW QUALITY PROTEIN: uncharacterized protein LOC117890870 [Drosophila subobscura]|uniref:LOW QUALITY PROTEIN: uncharacterized protein LOC117890870 n=1 Tax=Drosophila subobscura TaxID=7241 RepID=UPI00155AD598|nr:LOW QUALITY PROTEIN: uncharacterized protein LOC117890870 [Drosophila subobscura]
MRWMDDCLPASSASLLSLHTAFCLSSCRPLAGVAAPRVNGKATATFANFAATTTTRKRQEQQKQTDLHKCICIHLFDGRALYCSYVLDGPAKWRQKISKTKSAKQSTTKTEHEPFPNGKT